MAGERVSPLARQMKQYASGFGARIFEHKGASGTFYEDGSVVGAVDHDMGLLRTRKGWVGRPQFEGEQALHRDNIETKYFKDGVPVEVVRKDERELIEAQMRNDQL